MQCLCVLCPSKWYIVTHTHENKGLSGSHRTEGQAYHRVGCPWGLYAAPGQQVPPVPALGSPQPRLSH